MEETPPPILQRPGLRLAAMGSDRNGSYLKFIVDNDENIREVTIYMRSGTTVEWRYEYAIWDPATQTVVTYRGKHGDPEKDRKVSIKGVWDDD